MKRIDAHQHFWHYDAVEYGWIDEAMAALRRDFLPHDLRPLLSQSGFDGCVAVQARQTLEETRWLLSLADQLREFTRNPKLVGVRHILQAEPDDEFMLRADFRRGIAQLADFALAYDVLVYPRQLRAAVKFVSQFPEQRFVLDHIAKPLIAQAALEPWNTDIRTLAQLSNVWCKVSGMVTEGRWTEWRPQDFHPYLDVVFEAFGPERIMIGSDWPVCNVAGGYDSTMRIVTCYTAQLPAAQQEAVLGTNCAKVYRLPE